MREYVRDPSVNPSNESHGVHGSRDDIARCGNSGAAVSPKGFILEGNTQSAEHFYEHDVVPARMWSLYGYNAPRGTRWSPTTEQLRELLNIYHIGGIRTPTTAQISSITARLRHYGRIEGRNVFYWFQDQKARERKRRLQLQSRDAGCDPSRGREDPQRNNLVQIQLNRDVDDPDLRSTAERKHFREGDVTTGSASCDGAAKENMVMSTMLSKRRKPQAFISDATHEVALPYKDATKSSISSISAGFDARLPADLPEYHECCREGSNAVAKEKRLMNTLLTNTRQSQALKCDSSGEMMMPLRSTLDRRASLEASVPAEMHSYHENCRAEEYDASCCEAHEPADTGNVTQIELPTVRQPQICNLIREKAYFPNETLQWSTSGQFVGRHTCISAGNIGNQIECDSNVASIPFHRACVFTVFVEEDEKSGVSDAEASVSTPLLGSSIAMTSSNAHQEYYHGSSPVPVRNILSPCRSCSPEILDSTIERHAVPIIHLHEGQADLSRTTGESPSAAFIAQNGLEFHHSLTTLPLFPLSPSLSTKFHSISSNSASHIRPLTVLSNLQSDYGTTDLSPSATPCISRREALLELKVSVLP
uniref:Uncharacterized protein MOWOX n=1 Tax=Ceratopteris richardii TaxID=49495 RepID=G8YXX2_CERRI|nr:hypothetical protein [Ceratopteris richardii]